MFRALIVTISLTCMASALMAADAPSPQAVAEQRVAKPSLAERAESASPMMREIFGLLEIEQSGLTALYEEFATASSEDTALGIQVEIEQLKRTTEIGILNIQVRYAREAGRRDIVTRLEEALQTMDAELKPTQ